MNTEQLIQLGLTEEQATAVSTALEAQQMIPKARFDQVNDAKKALEAQVSDYDKQLDSLKQSAKGNEDLVNEINTLKQAQADAQTKYEQDIKDAKVNAAIQLAINGKVHDTDLVSSLFDRNAIQFGEDGKITGGLDEQLVSLKEAKSFLFVPEKTEEVATPSFAPKGLVPVGGTDVNNTDASLGAQIAQQMNTSAKPVQSSAWGQ